MERDLLVGSTEDGGSKYLERLGVSSVERCRKTRCLKIVQSTLCASPTMSWQGCLMISMNTMNADLEVRLSNGSFESESGEMRARKAFHRCIVLHRAVPYRTTGATGELLNCWRLIVIQNMPTYSCNTASTLKCC